MSHCSRAGPQPPRPCVQRLTASDTPDRRPPSRTSRERLLRDDQSSEAAPETWTKRRREGRREDTSRFKPPFGSSATRSDDDDDDNNDGSNDEGCPVDEEPPLGSDDNDDMRLSLARLFAVLGLCTLATAPHSALASPVSGRTLTQLSPTAARPQARAISKAICVRPTHASCRDG